MPYRNILSKKGLTEEFKEIVELERYQIAYYLRKSFDSKKDNEDALFINESSKTLRFGVSDGAGGYPKGADASDIVVNKASDLKEKNLMNLVNSVNKNVLDLSVGARATLVMGEIEEDNAHFLSVGDSEVIVWNTKFHTLYSNVPHGVVAYQQEGGVLDEEEALEHPERNIVTNLIGDKHIRVESTSKIELLRGYSILVGSDGLFDNLTHSQISDLLQGISFEEGFNKLIEELKEDKIIKDDDVSFIYLRKK